MTNGLPSTDAFLQPIDRSDWPPALSDLQEGFATKLNVYKTMAHHPALVRAWANLRNHVVIDSALRAELSEIVILRCGVHWRSNYEVTHHVHRARAIGFDEPRIERLIGPAGRITGNDRIVAEAADALLRDGRLKRNSLPALEKLLGVPGILDMMATIGMYTTLAFIVNSFETPIDDNLIVPAR